MRMRWTLLAAGLALLAVIGGYLWQRHRPGPQAPRQASPAMLSLPAAGIRRIDLDSARGLLRLEKRDGQWTVAGGPPVRLAQVSVDNLLYVFSRLEAEELIAEQAADLSAYGLASPSVRATAFLADGTTAGLLLGDPTPARSAYYAQVQGQRDVYTVARNIGEYLNYTLDDLRPRRLPPIRGSEITYLLARRGAIVLEFREKTTGEQARGLVTYGNYMITRPYHFPQGVSSERFPGLVVKIDDLRIDGFVSDAPQDLARYGLDRPWGELLVKDHASVLHLLFGSGPDREHVYFKQASEPNVYAIEAWRIAFLKELRPFDYIDKFIFLPELPSVDRIVLEGAAARHVLEVVRREGEEPRHLADGVQRKPEAFKSFYQNLVGLYVEGEVERQPSGSPEWRVRFILNSGPRTDVTIRYLPYDRKFLAVEVDGTAEFAISREQVDRLLSRLEDLLKY